ncbi:MAG: hypothetical protein ABMA64_01495, partial [Myxococcota bacterium]
PPPPPEPLSPLVDLEPPESRITSVTRQRRRAQSPALHLAGAAVVRPGTTPGGLIGFGWDLERVGPGALAVDLGVTTTRELTEMSLDRAVFGWDARASYTVPLYRSVAVAPELGLTYRLFRQQFNPVDEAILAFAGARLDLGSLHAGKWHLGPFVSAAADLGVTTLVDQRGRVFELSPYEVGFGLRLRFDGSDDPLRRVPTSTP